MGPQAGALCAALPAAALLVPGVLNAENALSA